MSRSIASLLLVVLFLLVACVAPGSNPAAPAPQSVAPAATPAGPAVVAAPPTASGPADAVPAGAASGPAGTLRLIVKPDGTEARYRVREQMVGRDLPNDAVGTTKAVSGTIVIQPDGSLVPGRSRIVVDVSSLQSDQGRRDNFIKRNTLETTRYPTAEFVPTSVQGLPAPLPQNGDVTFQVVGDMTAHGTTRPATWQVTAHIAGQEMQGTATTSFKFADFKMTAPKVPVLLSLEDNIKLELDFHVAPEG